MFAIAFVIDPSNHPSSTKGTNKGQGWLMTVIVWSVALILFSYSFERIVATVPITPMCLLRVACMAALTPGSITPTTGTPACFWTSFNASADAVLHAITIILAPFDIRKSAI